MCGSRKYPYPPHGRDWNFQGGGGSKAQENPEGGVLYQFILFFSRPLPLFLYVKFS